MNGTVAVSFGVHMFPSLAQVHEDEGRSVVISVPNALRSRADDDKAAERPTLFQ